MLYKTRSQKYNINELSEESQNLFYYLLEEYKDSKKWESFQDKTFKTVLEISKKESNEFWNHPIYKINMDLTYNIGIRENQFKGELSEMLSNHS